MTTDTSPSRPLRWLGAGLIGASLLLAAVLPAAAATPVQRVKSPGGLEAWLIESHEIGIISMRVNFEGGVLAEPRTRLASRTSPAFLFNEGAGALDTEALSRQAAADRRLLRRLGRRNRADVTFSAPSTHKQEAFALLRAALLANRAMTRSDRARPGRVRGERSPPRRRPRPRSRSPSCGPATSPARGSRSRTTARPKA